MKQVIKALRKAAIIAAIFLGVALWQTHDSRDPHSPDYIPPRSLDAAEVEQLNDLGGHDADTDIQWSYKK